MTVKETGVRQKANARYNDVIEYAVQYLPQYMRRCGDAVAIAGTWETGGSSERFAYLVPLRSKSATQTTPMIPILIACVR